MIDIKELVENGKLRKGLPKRLKIDGQVQEMDTFFVPIKYLYYNDQNGRISTYIARELNNSNKNLNDLLDKDVDEYNRLIARYIKLSSDDKEKSFKKTKEDIRSNGQLNPGVVLSDGRIVDGNRRFTAIKELFDETGDSKFEYFEAVVLKAPKKDDDDAWKIIKKLELNIQFDRDEPRGYNRIDFLYSFYIDVMDPLTKRLTAIEYMHESGMKSSDYNKTVRVVDTILDYLKWRKRTPKDFYVLKEEKLDGPIEDLANIRKKMSDEEWTDIKDDLYFHMTLDREGDNTRKIRELAKAAKENDAFWQRYKETKQKNENNLDPMTLAKAVNLKNSNRKLTSNESAFLEEVKEDLIIAFDDAKYFSRKVELYKKSIESLDEIIKNLQEFEITKSQKKQSYYKKCVNDKLDKIENEIFKIRETMKNE